MINAVQKGMLYEIRFPYNTEIIEIVKSVPGRVWVPEKKCWTIPLARLGFLIASIRGTKFEPELLIQSAEELDVNQTLDSNKDVPDIDISDVDLYVEKGSTLFQHQIDSIKYDKWRWEHGLRSGFILSDQPGLGKTLSVLNIAMYHRKKYGSKHCLVICCVNSAKYNWRDDILKHSNETITPYILGTRMKRDGSLRYDGSGKEKFQDFQTMKVFGKEDGSPLPYFLILNIEAIGRTKIGKTHVITQAIIDLIQKGEIGVVAVDEIHLNCLEYNTLIRTDRGLKKIGDIVKTKSKLNVLSYDTNSNKYVYKPIENWHSVTVDTQLLELVVEEEGCRKTIQCTPNHLFYTRNRGWVSAANLSEFDDIVLNKEYIDDN